jgi:hypothetical protein
LLLSEKNYVNTVYKFTVEIVNLASCAAVLLWQDVLRDELVQGLHVRMDVDAVADLLLDEGLHPVNDGVDDGRRVHHVHLLQLDRVGFLDAHQELLDDGGRDLREVINGGDAGVQNEDISGDSDLLGGEPHVPDHERDLHDVGDVGRLEVLDGGAHDGDAFAVGGQARKGRTLPATTK